MPIRGFEWMTAAEARHIDWLAQTEEQPVGYFTEASNHYPVDRHEAHNDDPLAAERLVVQGKMLSENQVELPSHYTMSRSAHSTMKIPNLRHKCKELVHYLILRFYLEQCMRRIDVPRVLHFQQSRSWARISSGCAKMRIPNSKRSSSSW